MREAVDPAHQVGGVRAVREERVLAEHFTGGEPVQAVAAEHDRPELGRAHQREPDARVVDERGQQVRELRLDRLQLDPAGVLDERHHRHVPRGDGHDAGGHPRDQAWLAGRGARAIATGALHPRPQPLRHRAARLREHRADLPRLGRAPGFPLGRAARRVAAAEPSDQFLDRLAEPVGERFALGLPVVGQRDEQVAPRRQLGGSVQAADLAVDLAEHGERVEPLDAGVVGDLVVAEEIGVDAGPAASMSSMIAETTTSRAITFVPARANG